MAEVVGLAASVIAIVELTAKLAGYCKFYIENVKDARKDLRKVLIETTSLQGIVENLWFLLDHDPDFEDAELGGLDAADGPISGCLECLKQLENLRHKATMSLIICGDISRDVKALKTEVAKVCQMLTDSERMSFLSWLCSVNPSDLRNRASSQYQEGTGSWVLRHPDWNQWIDLRSQHPRCLWIHGIPGSGKTVLAPYIYSQLLSMRACGQFDVAPITGARSPRTAPSPGLLPQVSAVSAKVCLSHVSITTVITHDITTRHRISFAG
ncbi:hypothetical protein QBC33DRAFT_621567 [Phialemonium atrogriseum]|uniref:Nephrocystin 3-like N-terminal domain-containing protein n=1 Tax=Phialemonium atrogriseum TaxID=1093897 RepID=A0AAJ0BVV1_9PEZI|nr:uncharacterized protein QBC33DRAFT_621567 [Phialemonium atrogriseum]KAK1764942.1 hypothetical protein QBC33DRAFT_621567 [Phialemonium atrogriseum]